MRTSAFSPLVLALLLVFLPGCKSFLAATGDNAEPEYTADAAGNLKKGSEAMDDHDFPAAEKYFEHVKTKFPYQDAAREAELRLADNSFAKDSFEEARDRYNNFVKLHPTHPRVDYAAFRAALSHLKQFKATASDFFIFPPAFEKDQAELRASLQSMEEFQRNYSTSSLLPEAKKVADDARRQIAAHEMYVADFYAKRSRYPAAAARWQGVVDKFPQLGPDQDALFKLVSLYRSKLKDPVKARAALQKVIERYPNTSASARAQRMLAAS